MHISKIALNFALMTAIILSAAISNASSSCNMRDGKGRYAASNPERKTVSSSKAFKQSKAATTKSYKGKK